MKISYNTVETPSDKIDVCYSANYKIFGGIVMSVLSILKHTPKILTVYLLTMDLTHLNENFKPISKRQADALNEVVKKYNPQNSVVLLDETELFISEFAKSKNIKTGYTPYTITRLLLDLLNVPEKIIYIDADTMCCSDLSQLFNVDVEEYEFAASLDIVGHIWVRYNYCNAGILLLNIKKIRETKLFEKARVRVNKRKMFMPDQSAINFLAKKKLYLPYKFNEQRAIKPDTVIKHFCQGFKWYGPFFKLYNYKQWHRQAVREKLGIHDFDDIYELYDGLDEKYKFNEF